MRPNIPIISPFLSKHSDNPSRSSVQIISGINICLFPAFAPTLRSLLAEGTMATFLPYLIFILIVTSLVSLAFYYDSSG